MWTGGHATTFVIAKMPRPSPVPSTRFRSWLADETERIAVIWLPTYSPHLNLIERVWRFVKSKLACHRHGNDLTSLIHTANHIRHAVRAEFAAPTEPRLTLRHNFC